MLMFGIFCKSRHKLEGIAYISDQLLWSEIFVQYELQTLTTTDGRHLTVAFVQQTLNVVLSLGVLPKCVFVVVSTVAATFVEARRACLKAAAVKQKTICTLTLWYVFVGFLLTIAVWTTRFALKIGVAAIFTKPQFSKIRNF